VLAVVDVVDSPLTARATHVLAVAGQLERADVLLQEAIRLRAGTQYTPAVVAPGAGRRPAWWVFAQLARRLTGREPDGGVLDGRDPDATSDDDVLRAVATARRVDWDALTAAGPRGLETAPSYGWVHADVLDGGTFTLAPPEIVRRCAEIAADLPPAAGAGGGSGPARLVLTPRREPRSMNSAHYADQPDRPRPARVHPSTLAAAGLADGDRARVRSPHGSLAVVARADAAVRPGAVSIVHGWGDANVAQLTSTRAGVDTLTGMPQLSGVAVDLVPDDAAEHAQEARP
jgi:anaerobic selenocysteine-containing dehydrogenase